MEYARTFINGLTRIETAGAVAGLALTAIALLADLAARELFGQGLFGALRVAVYATAFAAMFGFLLCIAHGAHIRVTALDNVVAERWRPIIMRIGDVISAAICIYFAYWSFFYVSQTYGFGETDSSLNVRVWPMQSILVWAFFSGALRFTLFAVFPALRPAEAEVVS